VTVGAAIIGSGNIGTDLMIKLLRLSPSLHVTAMVGIDPASDGLARARRAGVATSAGGVEALVAMPEFADTAIVFDATSAGAHHHNNAVLSGGHVQVIDLTPAAIGPYVVPPVNLPVHLAAPNLNMVSCGGQATVPIVAAVSRVAPVPYAEIVSSIASRSAGPGTRVNIDEFTETTARALETVGGAGRGKAIIILNPAEPPIIMRNTVFCVAEECDASAVRESVHQMVASVQEYVPGYLLKQAVQVVALPPGAQTPVGSVDRPRLRVSVYLEVTGAAHYLPAYAGNLDIMTSAALRTARQIAELRTLDGAAR
jgi:acetaldehyde dehydrogenase